MKKAAFLFLFLPCALASDGLESARTAMDFGFPHVAVQKIKEATTGGGFETAGAKKLLARALIEDGRPAEAIALLNGGRTWKSASGWRGRWPTRESGNRR